MAIWRPRFRALCAYTARIDPAPLSMDSALVKIGEREIAMPPTLKRPSPSSIMPPSLVHVIEDDLLLCLGLQDLFHSIGVEMIDYASIQDFLAAERPDRPSCLLTDVRLPDGNGLDLLEQVARSAQPLPTIIMTGYGDVAMCLRAMKAGAIDFLLKPLREQDLLDAVTTALATSQKTWAARRENRRLKRCFDSLSTRQRQVMTLVASGRLNKQAAAALDLSETTVKTHRREAMRKMEARSMADLVRMADQLGLTA